MYKVSYTIEGGLFQGFERFLKANIRAHYLCGGNVPRVQFVDNSECACWLFIERIPASTLCSLLASIEALSLLFGHTLRLESFSDKL